MGMNYDKNSFLSGVAVGRQLKGWGQTRGGGPGRVAASIAAPADPADVRLSAGAAPAAEWEDNAAAVDGVEEVQI